MDKLTKLYNELYNCKILVQKNDKKFNTYALLFDIVKTMRLHSISNIFFNKMTQIYSENKLIQEKMNTIYTLIKEIKSKKGEEIDGWYI